MERFIESIQTIVPTINKDLLKEPFRDAGIDSIDLVAIRVNFEQILQGKIPDDKWLDFENLIEIIDYCKNSQPIEKLDQTTFGNVGSKYSIVVNMPQMALGALSENWLFKEIGGIHWDKICEGLNESSFNLRDDLNNRLYATFVRIRLEFSGNLKSFKENDCLKISNEMKRFGESMYFSEIEIREKEELIKAELMTTFSIRNSVDNKNLSKSQPKPGPNSIDQLAKLPDFGNDYRLLKKGQIDSIQSEHFSFQLSDTVLFETEYELNPYYDLNGVNLLYFAAYPIINDNCEAIYFNKNNKGERWEQSFYTTYKDIFYFANCNIDDTLIYRLLKEEKLKDGSIQIQSELLRKSDSVIIAKIFSVKSKLQ